MQSKNRRLDRIKRPGVNLELGDLASAKSLHLSGPPLTQLQTWRSGPCSRLGTRELALGTMSSGGELCECMVSLKVSSRSLD